jgi:hypothetical protein
MIRLYYVLIKIIRKVSRARVVANQKHEAQKQEPRPELTHLLVTNKIYAAYRTLAIPFWMRSTL